MITSSLLTEIKESYNFDGFKTLVAHYAANEQSSGEISAEHIAATKLNAQRIQRITKTCELMPQLQNQLQAIKGNYIWLILVETWCGDGAQCLPVIAKMADGSQSIELKIILRDEHPYIMDAFETNGSRSIPKLICIDKNTEAIIGTWGPRPKAIQEMVSNFKKENPGVSHDDFVKHLHLWYARDKTHAIQSEFIELISKWHHSSITS